MIFSNGSFWLSVESKVFSIGGSIRSFSVSGVLDAPQAVNRRLMVNKAATYNLNNKMYENINNKYIKNTDGRIIFHKQILPI